MKYEFTSNETRIAAAFEADPIGFIINNQLRLESKYNGNQGYVVRLEQAIFPFAYSAFILRDGEAGKHNEYMPDCVLGLVREVNKEFMVPALNIVDGGLFTDLCRPEAIKHDLIHNLDLFLKGAGITRRTQPDPLGTVHVYETTIGEDNFYNAFLVRKEEENFSHANLVEIYIFPAVVSLLKQKHEAQLA